MKYKNPGYDYRENTGTDVLPEFRLRGWIIEGLLELQVIYSEMLDQNNIEKRRKDFSKKVMEIHPFIQSYIDAEQKFTNESEELQNNIEQVLQENGNLKKDTAAKFMIAINKYYYAKGFTALDAKNEKDYNTILL